MKIERFEVVIVRKSWWKETVAVLSADYSLANVLCSESEALARPRLHVGIFS